MNILGLRSDTHAVKLLTADHRQVDGLFEQFESATHKATQVSLITQICRALIVHAEIEERIFYPEARRVLDEKSQDMIDEAFVEHASLKGLIMRLDGMAAGDDLFKAYATVLKEYVQHHVKEEEAEFFPKVEKTDLDLEMVGTQMKALKDQLMRQTSNDKARGRVVAKMLSKRALPKRAKRVAKKAA